MSDSSTSFTVSLREILVICQEASIILPFRVPAQNLSDPRALPRRLKQIYRFGDGHFQEFAHHGAVIGEIIAYRFKGEYRFDAPP